ncbi:MAG: DUF3990 domain-containing protein [Clostridiales bacterium]|jgi:hypothetical protein|nr:DUF3990 domain-containing protein [Clostridiales bacterium]
MILYHGTTHDFTEIDITRGKPFKDFGQGFYATAVYEHARNLALRNRRIEESRSVAMGDKPRLTTYVYIYEFDLRSVDKLNVKRFDSADREWLKFSILNRTNRERQHGYDLVIGPTANDDTRTSIRTVTSAANGAILSDTALDLLLAMLEPDNLPTQYFFGSNIATRFLVFRERSVL